MSGGPERGRLLAASAVDGEVCADSLPRPQRQRWQPLRSGLLNLYRYDYEEFHFEDGHLLLRGHNGTGKSRVLALQLPFLFDGDVSSYRMEPDRDPAKRVEWNLLLGRHDQRLGYTWLEFGRRDEAGEEHYLTLGCGLRAVVGRGLVGKWLFLTRQRIGRDLFLQSASGHALYRRSLEEQIGNQGEVFATARQYRRAVDNALFKLGEQRYAALVDLLIQLRQPQLSRELDESRLSAALSEALPPLSAAVLDDIAEAFRGLEDERQAVEHLLAAGTGAGKFLEHYEPYARVAARRRAEAVRKTHAAYESVMRRLRDAERRFEVASEELAETRAEHQRLTLAEREAGARVQALAASPEMRDADALDAARRLASERQQTAHRAAEDHRSAVVTQEAQADQLDNDRAATSEARDEVEAQLHAAAAQAEKVGLGRHHGAAINRLGLPEGGEIEGLSVARQSLEEAHQRQRQSAEHLHQLVRTAAAAADSLRVAKRAQTAQAAELDEARRGERAAHVARAAATDSLLGDYRQWVASCVELQPGEEEDLAGELREWSQVGGGPSPLRQAARRAEMAAEARLAGLEAGLERQRSTLEEELAALTAEQQDFRRGIHRPPLAPHTREEAVRESRRGAPLWQLCDFQAGADPATRAGLEAALEAASLLDAWLTPAGRLLDAGDESVPQDTLLAADRSAQPEHTLAEVLRPVPPPDGGEPEVPVATVEAVLRCIGLGSGQGDVWVDPVGQWRVGPLFGRWQKPRAQHLGAEAREQERRQRLADLEAALEAGRADLAALREELSAVADRRAGTQREAALAPIAAAVRRALAEITARAAEVDRCRGRLATAESAVAMERRASTVADQQRLRTAEDLGLSAWAAVPRELSECLGAYREILAELWPTARSWWAVRQQVANSEERATWARSEVERCSEQRLRTEQQARMAAAERDTLAAAVGANVEEILARLEHARRQVEELRKQREEVVGAEQELGVERVRQEGLIDSGRRLLEQEDQSRALAIMALRSYVETGLGVVAIEGLEVGDPAQWSATHAVEVAREMEGKLSSVDSDEEAWRRHQRAIHSHFQGLCESLLRLGYQPSATTEHDLFLVTVPFQGNLFTMAELHQALSAERDARQAVLAAREQEVLENHLLGEVAAHLHGRLRAAEELVRDMNEELQERPMSTGMTLRFVWRPDADDPENLAARRLLLGASGTWSPEDRQRLGSFLHRLLDQERSENDIGTWREHLEQAFDYRQWHRFGVERQQDGRWKRLTRRTHGTGSGGEKAIALTMPQFAAAAAHYRTADPLAPRLILLDEAFVGVDADMRRKCMDLLTAFDLDFMMTSEREWGCYDTLKGLSIYHLSARPNIAAVGVSRWLWNGRRKVRQSAPLAPSMPPAAIDADSDPAADG